MSDTPDQGQITVRLTLAVEAKRSVEIEVDLAEVQGWSPGEVTPEKVQRFLESGRDYHEQLDVWYSLSRLVDADYDIDRVEFL